MSTDTQSSVTPWNREVPPHMADDSIFRKPDLRISEELSPITKPLYKEDVLEELNLSNYSSEDIPKLFTIRHCNQMPAKARIIKALALGHQYLQRAKLRQSPELTRSTVKKPKINEVLEDLENLFSKLWVLHDSVEVLAASPKPKLITQVERRLTILREEFKYPFVAEALAIPKPPFWAKNNDCNEWWSMNDFEILAVCYRHKVEMFLKMVSKYLLRVSKSSEKELEPQTPPEVVANTVCIVEPSSPKINRTRHFGEPDNLKVAPLSSMTTGGR
jgi:hypothetical protein